MCGLYKQISIYGRQIIPFFLFLSGYSSYETSSRRPIADDTEDNSDTATDILVNARVSPIETAPKLQRRRYRRDSIGSTSEVSISSYSDIDEQVIATMRKRSKSADGRGKVQVFSNSS